MDFERAIMPSPQYTELPERAKREIEGSKPPKALIEKRMQHFASVQPREDDKEGDTEVLDDATFTHHFVDVPGDYETVNFHYVEAGPSQGEGIVFLHGVPDSWFQFVHQMAALSKAGYHCVAPDLKGYGQSEKRPGDYRHEGAADQLYLTLKKIGLTKFNIVTHDRGTCQADYIVAKHQEDVLRYGRGEQHLYHFNPVLSPQAEMFMNAPRTGLLDDPKHFVIWAYTWIATRPIPDHDFERIIQEFSYPGIPTCIPRYFHSSTFRAE